MQSAQEVVERDLDWICGSLREEFARIGGSRLLVTGGAGFLGHYLVQGALRWNRDAAPSARIHVTVYDNFVRGVPPWLERLSGNGHLDVVTHDVVKAPPDGTDRFAYMIHAASIASPTYYRRDPLGTMDANVNGLRFLLDRFRARAEAGEPVGGFLFYSSSEIYGDPTPENIPTPETYRGNVSCTGPRACYDEAKRYGETLCATFAQQFELPVKVARPFNNYGPGLKITDGRVIPDFARNVLRGEDIVMLSDGAPKRTFCYVADAVIGYYKILVRGGKGEAYNVGVEEPEISVAELAEKIVALGRELFGYKGRVIHRTSADRDYLVDNPGRRCPVIAKARTQLGYAPGVTIDEGLRRSLLWYAEHREAEER